MATVLDNQEVLTPPDGGIFIIAEPSTEITPEASVDGISDYLRTQKQSASKALETLPRLLIEEIQDKSGLLSEEEQQRTRSVEADVSALWRHQVDEIGLGIAQTFPRQVLSGPFFDSEQMTHLSDGVTLFGVDQGLQVFAYKSFLSQAELNAGISMATREMWVVLLSRIQQT